MIVCSQTVYGDGHERHDVVTYRQEVYVPTMMRLEPLVRHYSGENMADCKFPTVDPAEEYVILFHDESCFHANDGSGYYWRQKGTSELRKKERGSALMVSAFLCSCHALCDKSMAPLGIPGQVCHPGRARNPVLKLVVSPLSRCFLLKISFVVKIGGGGR